MNIHNFTFVDRKFLRRENYRRCKFGDLSFPYRRIENSWDKIIQVRDDLVNRYPILGDEIAICFLYVYLRKFLIKSVIVIKLKLDDLFRI